MAGIKNWREVRGERPLNWDRVERFKQLMDSQQRIADALEPHGVTDAELELALSASEPALPREEHDERDFYHPALELYVAALGGRLERGDPDRAVFATVTVALSRPDRSPARPGS